MGVEEAEAGWVDQSLKTVSINHIFWGKRWAKAESNLSQSAYQSNALYHKVKLVYKKTRDSSVSLPSIWISLHTSPMHYTTRLNPPTKRQETFQCLYLLSGSVCIPVQCVIPQGQTHSQKDKRPFSVFIFNLGQSAYQSNALLHKVKPTYKKTRDHSVSLSSVWVSLHTSAMHYSTRSNPLTKG